MKLHSQVGLITNSSTVIYTSATEQTVETARALINGILKMAREEGCSLDMSFNGTTVDDLYDVNLVPNDRYLEYAADGHEEEIRDWCAGRNLIFPVWTSNCDYKKYHKNRMAITKQWAEDTNFGGEEYGYGQKTWDLLVTDKNGNEIHDFNNFLNSQETDSYDG